MADTRNPSATKATTPLPGFRLVGEDGNAFYILGRFRACAKRAGLTREQIDAVCATARSGDYENLLRTFIPYSCDGLDDDDD